MTFKDKLNLNWWNRLRTHRLRSRMKRLYRDQIKSDLIQLDLLQNTISDTEKQLLEWENILKDNTSLISPQEVRKNIDLYKAYRGYLKIECYLILLELDLYVAIKHLFISTDDWEARFFARRCFTLMFEMNESLDKAASPELKILKDIIDADVFYTYIEAKRNILNYLKPNLSFFKEIRNAGEAHKDMDYCRQITALESISIKKSYEIVYKFFNLLLDLSMKSSLVSKNLFKLQSAHLKTSLEEKHDPKSLS